MISIDQYRVHIGCFNLSCPSGRSGKNTKAQLNSSKAGRSKKAKKQSFGMGCDNYMDNDTTLIKLHCLPFVLRMVTIANILIFLLTPYLCLCTNNYEAVNGQNLSHRLTGEAVRQSVIVKYTYNKRPFLTESTILDNILPYNVLKTQLIIGNIEVELGPEFSKIICGSFNQGNAKFQNAAGKQCAAISLYTLAFSTVKDTKYWTSDTLDSLVEHGTSLYEKIVSKKTDGDDFLTVEDLPNVVEIFDEPISVQFQMNAHGLLNKQELYINSMKNTIRDNSDNNNCNRLLLWLASTTVSVIVKGKNLLYLILMQETIMEEYVVMVLQFCCFSMMLTV